MRTGCLGYAYDASTRSEIRRFCYLCQLLGIVSLYGDKETMGVMMGVA